MNKNIILLWFLLLTACSPIKKYESLPEVKAWEPDIAKFEELDRTENYQPDAILFTGSSSIRLWSTIKSDMAPYNVIQRGFGGSKLSDFVVYADRIISPHPCNAIVIFIANDITGSDKDKSPEEVASLFSRAIKIIRKTHKETPLFWIQVTPTPSRWKAWQQIKEANTLIQNICDRQANTYFISTESFFLGSEGKPIEGYFVSDKLHLNTEGYKLWTQIIKKAINNVVPFPRVEIIAHRGASFIAPENTLPSANLAWKLNADAVECDIHLSSDGKIMVSHDSNTKRASGEDLVIKNTTADELRKLDVGSFKGEIYKGEKIPLLEELINTVPSGKELVIEIKCGAEVLGPLKKIVESGSKKIKYTFIAFDFNTITLTKKAFPGNACYWLCSDPELYKKNIDLVKGANLEGVSLGYNLLNEEVSKQVHDLGLGLFTWTVDDPDVAKRMVSLGVLGITTNRPDYIREQLYGSTK